MKFLSHLLFISCLTPLASIAQQAPAISPDINQQLSQEAQSIIKQFSGELKQQLKQGMKNGGPVAAIHVCSAVAPAIAISNSKDGWTIKRTSLKVRNANNKATDSELKVLQSFENKKQQGIKVSNINHTEIIDNQFVYMQAIGTNKVCLNCHGSSLKPDTKKALNKLYPNDLAIGFKEGDIRGAFVLIKDIATH